MTSEEPGGTTTTTQAPAGRRLGDYELLQVIGRGGMGVVYKARQISLNRIVAVKVLPTFASFDTTILARFQRESEATSRLQHPGIVPVYDCGEQDGTHYFSMGLVEGPTLTEVLGELASFRPERLTQSIGVEGGHPAWQRLIEIPGEGEGNDYVRSCAQLAADAASAVAAAHHAQIVHRDLKPSNILMHPSGRAVIVDFGLARDAASSGLTLSFDAIGTPSYMSPEQALGLEVDTRSDIYSLGATLYELLTLRPPFEGSTPADTMRQIAEKEPVPVRRLNSQVPLELETILHKCLAKDPERRYPAIEAVEIDLRSFLMGRPILAERGGFLHWLSKQLRRRRRTALVVVATIVTMALLFAVVGVSKLYEEWNRGAAALAEARDALVEAKDLTGAFEAYGRAQVLVDDPVEIRAARRDHVRAAFQRHYPGELQFLHDLFAALGSDDRAALSGLATKLDGRGGIRLAGVPSAELRDTKVEVRALRDGVLEPEWRVLQAGSIVVGEYLVRISRPEHEPRVQAIQIVRDRRKDLDVRLISAAAIPSGMALAVDAETDTWLGVARTELTRSEYSRLLQSIDDPDLREELTPSGWLDREGGNASLPVRGLSFFQARAAAAHLGGHLPTLREFRIAGTAGLDGLRRPWGNEYRAGVIVAGADRREGPESVMAMSEGASPLGVKQLFGNVAEYLVPSASGDYLLAGGHFHTHDPQAMRFDAPGSFLSRWKNGARSSRYAGMRLLRFVAPPDDSRAREQAMAVIAGLAAESSSISRTWRIHDDGRIDYRVTLTGFRERPHEHGLRFATPGFLHGVLRKVVDGHGRGVRGTIRTGPFRESTEIIPDAQAAGRRRFRWQFETILSPTTGLRLDGARYVMQFSLAATPGVRTLQQLGLPAGAQVGSVNPKPDLVWREASRWHLAWLPKSNRGIVHRLAQVRFRVDGMLTTAWPVRRRAESFVRRFLGALTRGDGAVLSDLIDPAYREDPAGLGFSARTESPSPSRVENIRIRDVTAVGDVVTVEFVADRLTPDRAGGAPRLNWPMRLQLKRAGDTFRVLRFAAQGRGDVGHVDRDGAYRSDRLGIRIVPPAATEVRQLRAEHPEMQVAIRRADDPNVEVLGLGVELTDDETEAAAMARLMSGLPAWPSSLESRPTAMGPESALIAGHRRDAVTQVGNRWSRERRVTVRRGRRWFVFRFRAQGASRTRAEAAFAARGSWFEQVSRQVEIR